MWSNTTSIIANIATIVVGIIAIVAFCLALRNRIFEKTSHELNRISTFLEFKKIYAASKFSKYVEELNKMHTTNPQIVKGYKHGLETITSSKEGTKVTDKSKFVLSFFSAYKELKLLLKLKKEFQIQDEMFCSVIINDYKKYLSIIELLRSNSKEYKENESFYFTDEFSEQSRMIEKYMEEYGEVLDSVYMIDNLDMIMRTHTSAIPLPEVNSSLYIPFAEGKEYNRGKK